MGRPEVVDELWGYSANGSLVTFPNGWASRPDFPSFDEGGHGGCESATINGEIEELLPVALALRRRDARRGDAACGNGFRGTPAGPETNGPVSLADAVRLATIRNWDLLAAQADVDRATAEQIIAQQFPNPTLSISVTKAPINS